MSELKSVALEAVLRGLICQAFLNDAFGNK